MYLFSCVFQIRAYTILDFLILGIIYWSFSEFSHVSVYLVKFSHVILFPRFFPITFRIVKNKLLVTKGKDLHFNFGSTHSNTFLMFFLFALEDVFFLLPILERKREGGQERQIDSDRLPPLYTLTVNWTQPTILLVYQMMLQPIEPPVKALMFF